MTKDFELLIKSRIISVNWRKRKEKREKVSIKRKEGKGRERKEGKGRERGGKGRERGGIRGGIRGGE